MKSAYEAPVLTRFGRVEGLTASNLKCSLGQDFNYDFIVRHVEFVSPPAWHDPNTGQPLTLDQVLALYGPCIPQPLP